MCLIEDLDASEKDISLFDAIVQQDYYQRWSSRLLASNVNPTDLDLGAARRRAERDMKDLLVCSRGAADINMRTQEGWTALHLAASYGHESVVRLLTEEGALIDAATNSHRTALQLAAEHGHLETVRNLLEAGANVNARSDKIGVMLEDLHKLGHTAVVDLLLWHLFHSKFTEHCRTCQRSLLRLATKNTCISPKSGAQRNSRSRKHSPRPIRGRSSLRNRDNLDHFPSWRTMNGLNPA